MAKIKVLNSTVAIVKRDYISLTDIARSKNPESPKDVVKNWLRNKNTIEYLGLWEKINNPDFKGVEFDTFKNEAGLNSFTLSPSKWCERTKAVGLLTKQGRYGGTYAHKDIAFEFASWVSAEFKLYLIKEFQRLKEDEQKQLGWDIKRNLTKINYRIHTDAIKENLLPKQLTPVQVSFVYASEADLLNVALFGMTAKQWKVSNPELDGNIRDYADVNQLVCLANLESLNAHLITEGLSQQVRVNKLNKVAISQMSILLNDKSMNKLKQR